jgi:hypothetical protein
MTLKDRLIVGVLVAIWLAVFVGSLVGGYFLDINGHDGWAIACYVFAAILFAGTWAG